MEAMLNPVLLLNSDSLLMRVKMDQEELPVFCTFKCEDCRSKLLKNRFIDKLLYIFIFLNV